MWWWHYGVTKDPTKNDLLLVYYDHNSNLPENLLGVTLKYKIDGLIDKLQNTLNTLNKSTINRNSLPVKTIKTIETTIKILKTIEDCANYKDKEVGRNSFDEVYKATWINHHNYHRERLVIVLKRIYNSSNKIVDILKEVK